ncbi:MAG: aquaporin [Anaerolineae bacterium]|nr:aquaporin [Anaerolineae bacterium]
MDNRLLRDGVAELIGTFMLVLVGAGAVTILNQNPPAAVNVVVAALAHGLILVVIASTYGHISGAHVNPAVTLALLVGRQINLTRAVVYWVAQFAGGIIAAGLLRVIFPAATNLGQTVPVANISGPQALMIEAILTFFLASTVYQAAVYGKVGNIAAISIGFTLAACILFGGPLTGGSLNPARTLGPALFTGDFNAIVYYMIGIFGGGAIAGLVHTAFFPKSIGADVNPQG